MTRRAFLQLLALFLMRPNFGTDTPYWLLDVSRLGVDTVLAPSPFALWAPVVMM